MKETYVFDSFVCDLERFLTPGALISSHLGAIFIAYLNAKQHNLDGRCEISSQKLTLVFVILAETKVPGGINTV